MQITLLYSSRFMPNVTIKSQIVLLRKVIKKSQWNQLLVFCMFLAGFLIMKEQGRYTVFIPNVLYIWFLFDLLFFESIIK